VKRPAAAAAGLLTFIAITGCFGQGSGNPQAVDAGPRIQRPLGLANCTDWQKADAAERLGTIEALENFAGGPVGSSTLSRGPVLDEKQAFRVLDGYCGQRFARGFKLYKLYTRAASFAGH
jgi:hypothetical protein